MLLREKTDLKPLGNVGAMHGVVFVGGRAWHLACCMMAPMSFDNANV